MARKKVKVAYIENNYARKVAYKKRVSSLVKQAEEISVLCGVDACAIIYGQDDQAPITWPSSQEEVTRIISDFVKGLELDPPHRVFNNQTFLKESVDKTKERLLKLQQKTREKEIWNIISDILSGKSSLDQVKASDFGDLLWAIEDKIRAIEFKLEKLRKRVIIVMILNQNQIVNKNGRNIWGMVHLSCNNI